MATTRHFPTLISADSHAYEPSDLWWKALGPKFGDRTPRIMEEYQGEERRFVYTGYQTVLCPGSESNSLGTPRAQRWKRRKRALRHAPAIRPFA